MNFEFRNVSPIQVVDGILTIHFGDLVSLIIGLVFLAIGLRKMLKEQWSEASCYLILTVLLCQGLGAGE